MTIFASILRAVRDRAGTRRELARLDREVAAQRHFSYVRVGHDQRTIELLPDHRIGRGADIHERRWRVISSDGTPSLQITGDDAITCRLSPSADGTWRGRWLAHEMMDVRLRPIADRHPPLPGPAVAAARTLLRGEDGARPAYEILQHYRRTVASDPGQKRLLPVRSATDAPRPFGRGVGQLSDEVLFSTLRDPPTGRTYWSKRYAADQSKQLEWEFHLYPALPGQDSRIVRPVDFTEQHGLIFDFDPELFGGAAVHRQDLRRLLSEAEADEATAFAESRVRHPQLGEMSVADLTDFQTVATSRGLRFIDFAIKPEHWWML